jgi:site-specific DNA recombinase
MARRKGKWSGGTPVLGYDAVATKLVVNELEAQRVREIFELYLESMSLLDTARELNGRGWRTKRWTTKKGKTVGGQVFQKNNLYKLLTNVIYVGKTRYKDEIHAGQHEAIVDADLFRKVQVALRRNGRTGGATVRNRFGALLKGILRCASCDCAMGHAFSTRGNRRYRYYVCQRAQQQGWKSCPAPSLPAGEIERFVVDEIRCIGRDPKVIEETMAQVRQRTKEQISRLQGERDALLRRLRKASEGDVPSPDAPACEWEARLANVNEELAQVNGRSLSEQDVASALHEFDSVWDALSPREQARLIALLVQQVDHNGRAKKVSITFRPTGIESLLNHVGEEELACTSH